MEARRPQDKQHDGSLSKNFKDHTTWRSIWKLKVKNKLKHFIWKCLHIAVPVQAEIRKRI